MGGGGEEMSIGIRKCSVGDEAYRGGEKLRHAGQNGPYQPISNLGGSSPIKPLKQKESQGYK